MKQRNCVESVESRLMLTSLDFTKVGDFASGITTSVMLHEATDFDGDGHLDIISLDITNNGIILMNGDGTGQLGTAQFFAADPGGPASNPQSLGVADFDGDGHADVVIGEFLQDKVTFFTNDGAGGFQTPTRISAAGHFTPRGIDIADLNGDATPDLVMNYFDGRFHGGDFGVWLNPGASSFGETSRQHIGAGGSISVQLGLFDGDAHLDAVVTTSQANVGFARGNGDGTFQAIQLISTGSLTNTINLEPGDFDSDGNLDVLVTGRSGPSRFMLGDGNGSFTQGPFLPTAQWNSAVRAADLDADGDLDLVANSFVRVDGEVVHGDDLYIIRNDGDLNNLVIEHTLVEPAVRDVRLADYNGDGQLDFSTSSADGNMTVYLHQSPIPTIASLSAAPDPVLQGADLTLTANGVDAAGSTIADVTFYHDVNSNGQIDAGTDVVFGIDTDGNDGWSVSDSTAGMPSGNAAFLAVATSSSGHQSDLAATTAQIDAAVYWDGDAGDLLWHSATNWSTDSVPTASDTIVINVAGDITVQINSGVTVNRLLSEESLSVNSVPLTVTGDVIVNGSFSATWSSVSANGVGAQLNLAGGASLNNANLFANSGGQIVAGAGSSYSVVDRIHSHIQADGSGSRIDLSSFADFFGTVGTQGHTTFHTNIVALNGGFIDLSNATEVRNQTHLRAEGQDTNGVASQIDLTSVTQLGGGGQGLLASVSSTGNIHLPAVQTITKAGLSASSGATLDVSAATTYEGDFSSHRHIRADGSGSLVDLSGLTTVNGVLGTQGHTIYYTNFEAWNGGTIDLSSVVTIANQTRINASGDDGAGTPSRVTLTSLDHLAGAGRGAAVSVSDVGIVDMPVVQTLTMTGLTASGGATLDASSVTDYQGGNGWHVLIQADGQGSVVDLSNVTTFVGMLGTQGHAIYFTTINGINGGLVDLSSATTITNQTIVSASGQDGSGTPGRVALTSLDHFAGSGRGSRISVSDVGIVDMPVVQTLTKLGMTAAGAAVVDVSSATVYDGGPGWHNIIRADGQGSVVDMSGVMTFAGATGRQGHNVFFTSVEAVNGGRVDLSNAQTSDLQTHYTANGSDGNGTASVIDLSALQAVIGNSRNSINVWNTGQILLPSIQSFAGTDLTANDGGYLDASNATDYSGLTVWASTIRATGAGSVVDLTGLQTLEGNAGNQGHSVWYLVVHGTNDGSVNLGTGTNSLSRRVTLIGDTGTITAGQLHALPGTTFGLQGTVTADVLNETTLQVGGNHGRLIGSAVIDGDFTQTANGTFLMQIGGTDPGLSFDQLQITGRASLDGVLNLAPANGYVPQTGDQLQIITYDSRHCDFHTKLGTEPAPGLYWAAAFSSSDMIIEAGSTPDAGQQCNTDPIDLTVEIADRGQSFVGSDTPEDIIRVVVTLTEAIDANVEAEFDAFQTHLDDGHSATPFTFSTLNITVQDFESFERVVEIGSFRGAYVNPITGSNSSETLTGTAEADLVVARGGNDTVFAGGGNDIVLVESGNDANHGEDGDDVFIVVGSNGYNTFDGGAGFDTVIAPESGTVIGLNGYDNGVDEFSGIGDTILRDVNSSRTLNFSNTLLTGVAEVDAAGGNDVVTASELSPGSYRGGTGNDSLIAGSMDVTWLFSGANQGYDDFQNGAGQTTAVAETAGTVIGLNGYDSGVDEFSGTADTILRDVNSSRTLNFSNTLLTNVAEIDAAGGNDVVTASELSPGSYRGGTGNDSLIAGTMDVTWLFSGPNQGYDDFQNGTGQTTAVAETAGTVIGLNGYDNGVDEFSGIGDTILRDVNSSRTLNFSNTLLTNVAEIDAAGGNDVVTASELSPGSYRGGTGNDSLIAGSTDVTWLFSGANQGYDDFQNGTGQTTAVAETAGTVIGLNGYDNGVDEFSGTADTILRDVNSSRTLNFSNTLLTGVAEIDAAGGNDVVTASVLSPGSYRGGTGNDSLIAGSTDVTWLFSGANQGYDDFQNGTGQTTAVAETAGTVIGLNGYDNGVDEFSGTADTILRDVNSSRTLNFSNTLLTGVAEIDAAGGNDVVTASELSPGSYRGGTGNDIFVVAPNPVEVQVIDFSQSGIDRIDLTGYALPNGFSDLTLTQEGPDTRVSFASTLNLKILDRLFGDLDEDDFLF